MKLTLLFSVLPLLCLGQTFGIGNVAYVGNQVSSSGSGGPNLMAQNFESGVQPAGWTQVNGTPTWNFTPALKGSFSVGMQNSTEWYYTLSSSVSEAFLFLMVNFTATPSANSRFIDLNTSGGGTTTRQIEVRYATGGALEVLDADTSHTATTVSTVTTATTTYVWLHYKAGSGANAVCTVAFSTTLSEPTSGNNFASIASADSTGNVGTADFQGIINTTVFDQIGVATFDLPTGW